MKRVGPFVIGLLAGAIVFGVCGGFLGYTLAHSGEPAVVVRNISATPIHTVRIKTDVGESYFVPDLPAHKSNRVHVSGRPKALRVSATTEAGRDLSSEEIYVTSEGVVFALVSSDGITVDYEL